MAYSLLLKICGSLQILPVQIPYCFHITDLILFSFYVNIFICKSNSVISFLLLFFQIDLRERKGERETSESETLIGCLLHAPRLGIEPTTWVYAPDQELNLQPFNAWDSTLTN